jgi:predicted transcriptional regulator of viral defense system
MARIEDTLRELAADNSGLITAREAAAEGIAGVLLVQLAQRGRLERVSRGIYRFPTWPTDELQEYHQAVL